MDILVYGLLAAVLALGAALAAVLMRRSDARGQTALADTVQRVELSLREHAIDGDWIALGVTAASLDVVIDEIEEGAKALLH